MVDKLTLTDSQVKRIRKSYLTEIYNKFRLFDSIYVIAKIT